MPILNTLILVAIIFFLGMAISRLKQQLTTLKDENAVLRMGNIQLSNEIAELRLHSGRIYRNVCENSIRMIMKDFPNAKITIQTDGHVTVENWSEEVKDEIADC